MVTKLARSGVAFGVADDCRDPMRASEQKNQAGMHDALTRVQIVRTQASLAPRRRRL